MMELLLSFMAKSNKSYGGAAQPLKGEGNTAAGKYYKIDKFRKVTIIYLY